MDIAALTAAQKSNQYDWVESENLKLFAALESLSHLLKMCVARASNAAHRTLAARRGTKSVMSTS